MNTIFFRQTLLAAGIATLGVMYSQSAQAATYYWNTTTTGTWTTGANWSDNATSGGTAGTVPTNDTTTDSVFFNQSSVNGATIAQMTAGTSISGITFGNTGTTAINTDNTGNRTLTLGAGGITINSGVGAVTFGTLANTQRVPLVLGASQSWVNNSSNALVLNNQNNLGLGANALTFDGTGDFATGVNTTISGAGGIIKSGAGTLTFAGTNSYTGTTQVTAGTLTLSSSLALQNSAFDTTGSIAGDASNGLKTTVTALTIGGLTGNKDLASVFTTTSGGYSAVTALTLKPIADVTATYAGAIADGAAGMTLSKTGAGTQILSGMNTYTGATTISAGILGFANKAARSSGTVVTATATGLVGLGVGAGGVTDYSNADVDALFNTGAITGISLDVASGVAIDTTAGDFTHSTALTAARALTKLGTNTLTLSGNNSYSGSTTVSAGTLSLTGSLTGGGAVTVSSSGALSQTSTGVISGASSITTSGITTLAGDNTYTGGTTLDAGTLNINSTTALGATASMFIIGNGGTTIDNTSGGPIVLANNNPITISGNVNDNYFTFGGTNDLNLGTGAVTLQLPPTTGASTGIIQLNGTNKTLTFGGAVTSPARGSSTTMEVNGAGNTLVFGSLGLNSRATANTNNTWSGSANVTVNGGVSDGGAGGNSFIYDGTGTFTIGGASTYSRSTTIGTNGTLVLGGTAGALTGTDGITNNGNLTINRSDAFTQATDLNGQAINGSGSFTQAGAGTTTLTLANTYSGATTVSGGTLGIIGTGTTGAGAVTVQNGGTILGTGLVKGAVFTAESGAIVHVGDGTSQGDYGMLSFTPASGSGSFDFQAGSTTILGINPGGISDQLSFDGLSNGTLNFNGNLTIGPSSFTPVAPEVFNLLVWGNLGTTNFASQYDYLGLLSGNGDEATGLNLPDISSSIYLWDISQFTTNGSIALVAVPEASRALLLMIGGLGLALRRRRR